MRDRLLGFLLFLPVPLVLWLFTRAPLGQGASLLLGLTLVATHRLYARPFALDRASRRCLWCGGPVLDGRSIRIEEPRGRTVWMACDGAHGRSVVRLFDFAHRHGLLLRGGILGTLALFLVWAALAASGRLGPRASGDAVAFFRTGVALTVLPLGWLGVHLGREAAEASRSPFPVHIQALVGTRLVMWLFRLVGILWLVQGARHVLSRL